MPSDPVTGGSRNSARRGALYALVAAGWIATATGPAGAAEVALEPEPGGVRLWSSPERSIEVPLGPSRSPRVAIEAEGGFVVAGTDEATGELFFLHRSDGPPSELPVPGARTGELRSWPVLVSEAGRLEGAVWLEGSGPQDFSIRAAAWNGASWEAVEIVAASRGRPQLAPSATVLDDGSWLAVWAGYDGDDDEIYWSRRSGGVWSAPRRLHPGNRVPDILPSVVAQGGGARAAWSFFDGEDYRVAIASWDGGGWSVERTLRGRGAIDAGWQRIGERVFVTYHSVVPEGWNLVEVSAEGGIAHQSRAAGEVAERPLVAVTGGSEPRLVFPARAGRVRR